MKSGKALCSVVAISLGLLTLTGCSDERTKVDSVKQEMKDSAICEDGKELRKECAEEESVPVYLVPEKVYDVVEQMPTFPSAYKTVMGYLSENIRYPAEAIADSIQGRVIVACVIEKDGSVSNVNVVKSIDPLLDAEAVRVVSSMPQWYPGTQSGIPVRVKYILPVTFQLPSEPINHGSHRGQ